jgi:hypothetical protein
MQINYCASLEKMFLLNPGSSLTAGWSVVEKFIDEETA